MTWVFTAIVVAIEKKEGSEKKREKKERKQFVPQLLLWLEKNRKGKLN